MSTACLWSQTHPGFRPGCATLGKSLGLCEPQFSERVRVMALTLLDLCRECKIISVVWISMDRHGQVLVVDTVIANVIIL